MRFSKIGLQVGGNILLIDIFRNGTLFLFWFLAFGVMAVIDFIAVVVACYFLKQFGEEWAETCERGRRRHGR